ncbi:MAG TPA: glycosyltransferase 87 family protein [Gaiella sp.]
MTDDGPVPRDALLAAAAFVLTAVTATVAWQLSGRAVTDIALYHAYGERIADGLVPYRDFSFEYPPGALPALVLPALVTDSLTAFRVVFAAEMAVAGAFGVMLLAAGLGRLGTGTGDRRVALSVVALVPLVLGGVILTRFDLVPAAIVAGAMLLLVTGRLRAGALVVGIGVAVKLYPAVLVPLVGVVAWRRGGRRELASVLALVVAPVLVAYLPFLVAAPDGVLDSLGRQLGRPLQIESLGAGVLLAVHHTVGTSLGWASSSGSQNLTGTAAGTLAVLQGIAQIAAVALVWVSFWRGPTSSERLVRHASAAVVAFVALSKVLSPQFLVWLVLLVPLVVGARGRAPLWLLTAACAVTAVWFPARYWELVKEFDPLASWLVLARGVLLLALLAVLMWPATERAPARSRSPVPSPDRT